MKKHSGFTLIEVMIVVVIVAILAAVAVPSYQDSIRKTRRADAKEALTAAAAREERYFFTNNSYTDVSTNVGIVGDKSSDGYYSVIFVVPENSNNGSKVECKTSGGALYPCFKLQANPPSGTPQAADTDCAKFYISHTGKKSAKDSSDNDTTDKCWK